jgi:hypothetical protein
MRLRCGLRRATAHGASRGSEAHVCRDMRKPLIAATVVLFVNAPGPLLAQAQRGDAGSDAEDARTDAMLAMPNLSTPAPLSNLYSTAPGLEEQIPGPQIGANFLAPFGWDSNPEEVSHGGPQSWETSPWGNVSMSASIGAPFRFTATGFGDLNRYFSASDANVDRIGGSARLQYVDPTNDQAFSPYVAIAPRCSGRRPTQVSMRRARTSTLTQTRPNRATVRSGTGRARAQHRNTLN